MSDQAVLSARLIGEIFVERGLISADQLEQALEVQQASGEMIGEVLVSSFGVSRIELASILAEQWSAMERDAKVGEAETAQAAQVVEPLHPVEPGAGGTNGAAGAAEEEEERRKPIGEIFVERGMATAEQLEHALALQHESGERLGEILVRLGVIGRLELAGALAEQWSGLQKLRPPAPKKPEPWNEAALAQPAAPAPAPSAPPAAPPAQTVDLGPLQESVAALQRQVTALASRPDPDLTVVRGEARAVEARVAELEERLAATAGADALADLSAAVADLRAAVDAQHPQADLAEVVSTLAARVEGLALPELAERVETVERSLEAITALQEEISRIDVLARSAAGAEDVDTIARRLDGAQTDATARADDLVARLDAVTGRLDELAAQAVGVEHPVDEGDVATLRAALDDLRARTDEALTALAARLDGVEVVAGQATAAATANEDALAERVELERLSHAVAALDLRIGELAPADRLEEAVRAADARAAESAAVVDALATRLEELEARPVDDVRPDLDALRGRVEELATAATAVPATFSHEELDELRARLEALASRPIDDVRPELAALEARVDELAPALATAADAIRPELDDVRASLAGLAITVEGAAPAADLEELRSRLVDLGERLPHELHTQVARIDALDGQLAGLAERLAAPQDHEVAQAVEQLRGEVAAVRTSLAETDDHDRLDGIAHAVEELRGWLGHVQERLDAAPGAAALDALGADVHARLDALAVTLADATAARDDQDLVDRIEGASHRIDRLASQVERLHDGDGAAQAAAALAALSAHVEELTARLDRDGAELRASDEALLEHVEGVRAHADRLAADAHAADGELRAALHEELDRRMQERASAARVEEVVLDVAALRVELDRRLAEVPGRDGLDELARALEQRIEEAEQHAAAAVAQDALDALVADLGERLTALGALAHDASARAAGAADAALAALDERAAGLVGREELEQRTAGLVGREELEQRIAGLVGREELDVRAHELAATSAEATARTAASLDALAVELRDSIAHVHARIDELAAGLGHATGRLAAVEQVAADGTQLAAVHADLALLRERVEHDAAVAEERSAVSERALRKGLAGLGERLVAGEQAYLEAGSALRRSIERLGAAVVEADARIAGEPLDPPAVGFVAFLPTADGYRLRALDGAAPALDAVLQVEDDGPWFRVVRVTVSPLPLDRRSCVYLEPA